MNLFKYWQTYLLLTLAISTKTLAITDPQIHYPSEWMDFLQNTPLAIHYFHTDAHGTLHGYDQDMNPRAYINDNGAVVLVDVTVDASWTPFRGAPLDGDHICTRMLGRHSRAQNELSLRWKQIQKGKTLAKLACLPPPERLPPLLSSRATSIEIDGDCLSIKKPRLRLDGVDYRLQAEAYDSALSLFHLDERFHAICRHYGSERARSIKAKPGSMHKTIVDIRGRKVDSSWYTGASYLYQIRCCGS